MSIQTQIDRIEQNVANTYSALQEKGATMPSEQNSNNLAATARTVPQGGGDSVQSDWNQTDETAADFIKNKPFGEVTAAIMEEQEVPFDTNEGACVGSISSEINEGDTITVVFDGVSYDCDVTVSEEMGGPVVFGNTFLMGFGDDTGEPFFAVTMGTLVLFLPLDENSHVICIIAETVKTLPYKYWEAPTFYIGDDEYIYTDALLTRKATKKEVAESAKKQNIRLVKVAMGASVGAMPVLATPIMELETFCVFAFDLLRKKVMEYYTAEYTPPTT